MADARVAALAKVPLFARVPQHHLPTIPKRMGE